MTLSKEYLKRRKKLMQQIGKDAIVIIPAARECLRNGDAAYAYRQHSDFYYLTGFEEPEALLVLLPKRKEGEFILFNRKRQPEAEVWDGPRAGQKGAVKNYGADQAFAIEDFNVKIAEMLIGRNEIYYPIGHDADFDRKIIRSMKQVAAHARKGVRAPTRLIDIGSELHTLRLVKSPAEVKLMQEAVTITAKAHIAAMQACHPGMYEYELEGILTNIFQKHGARQHAYTPIVGAGKNACVLHYVANNQKIGPSDLVLIDAGAEFKNYAADVTRTFPASGKFSTEQKEIYQLVLDAQLAALKTIKVGALWSKAQETIIKVLTQGLIDLKILKGKVDQLIEQKAYLPFYMHGSGHWLGLDVHDAGPYTDDKDQWLRLKENMTLTVEPGLYLSAKIPGLHKRWHNIGVRIEDDVVVTAKGPKILSEKIPKEIKDIEALMAR